MAPAEQMSYPLTGVAVGTLSRLRDDPEKYRRYYINATTMLAFIGMPISAILTFMGKDVVYFLLGSQWNEAGNIFSVLGFGIAIQILYGTTAWLHISMGRADRWYKWNKFASVVLIISFISGLRFGSIGVAVGYTLSLYFLLLPSIWYGGKAIDLKITSFLDGIWKYFVAAASSGVISWVLVYKYTYTSTFFLSVNVFIRLSIGTALCAIFYLLFTIAFYRGIAPIRQFIDILSNMIPHMASKSKQQ
jgi:PST family polysaccharide transporter